MDYGDKSAFHWISVIRVPDFVSEKDFDWAEVLRTPKEIMEMSKCYLSVLYYGVPVSFMNNLFSAILRAFGNSKTPLMAMTVSSIVNIIFDYAFVRWYQNGVMGVALSTVFGFICRRIWKRNF